MYFSCTALTLDQPARFQAAECADVGHGDGNSEQVFIADRSEIKALELRIQSKATKVVTGFGHKVLRHAPGKIVGDTKRFCQPFAAFISMTCCEVQQVEGWKRRDGNRGSDRRGQQQCAFDEEVRQRKVYDMGRGVRADSCIQ